MISAYRFDHRQLQQLCRLASDPKALTEAIFRAVAFKSHRGCSGLSPPRRAVHHIRMDHKTLNMPVGGMTCGNCARSVERTLGSVPSSLAHHFHCSVLIVGTVGDVDNVDGA